MMLPRRRKIQAFLMAVIGATEPRPGNNVAYRVAGGLVKGWPPDR